MAKSRTKEIAREKTPQERVKDSYSYEKAFDALPPLTEWDSRSLQQKMVGGFSSQSR